MNLIEKRRLKLKKKMTKIRAKSFWEGVTVSMIIQLLVYVWFKVI